MSKYVVWKKGPMNKTYVNNNNNNTNNNIDNNMMDRFETDTIMKSQLNEWKESSLKKILYLKDYLIEINLVIYLEIHI